MRSVAGIVLRPGVPPGTAERLSEAAFTPPGSGNVPPAIVNVRRVDRVPALLTALLSLLAVVLLVSVLAHTVRFAAPGPRRAAVARDDRCRCGAHRALAGDRSRGPTTRAGYPPGRRPRSCSLPSVRRSHRRHPRSGSSLALIGAVVLGWLLVANAVAVLPARRTRRTAPRGTPACRVRPRAFLPAPSSRAANSHDRLVTSEPSGRRGQM